MSRPRVLLKEAVLEGQQYLLKGSEARRLLKVLRLGPGDRVNVFDNLGMEGEASIAEVLPDGSITLQVMRTRTLNTESSLEILLVQGVPRPAKMDWVLQKCTELGIKGIGLLLCKRSFFPREDMISQKRWSRWQKILEEAARQSGRSSVPELMGPWNLKKFLEYQEQDQALRLVFWEGETRSHLREVLARVERRPSRAWVVVGPEGGLEKKEIEGLGEAGFVPVGLGPRILRTETAALAAVTILQYVLGDMGE
ncbi:MAG: 16S rRNA (uracil(1498)-N(3))-methyltransferase [bacterium]